MTVENLPISTAAGNDAPIGIFDSGVGGLTVARAIIDQLPGERVRYVGDTANGPYGPLTIAEVRRHALAIGDQLVDSGVKMLVIACNTASAACLADARERYDVPVIEVIRPAVRRAVAVTRTGDVGVIGTSATIESGAYQDAFDAAAGVRVHAVACPSFVDFVERGITSGRQVIGLAQAYLAPLQRTGLGHPGAGLHPLPAAHRRVVAGDGRSGDPGLQRGRDRQGRLPAAHRARSAGARHHPVGAARVPGHRRSGAVRPARATVPRPGDQFGGGHERARLTCSVRGGH